MRTLESDVWLMGGQQEVIPVAQARLRSSFMMCTCKRV